MAFQPSSFSQVSCHVTMRPEDEDGPLALIGDSKLLTIQASKGVHLGNRHYTDHCHTDELKSLDGRRDFCGFSLADGNATTVRSFAAQRSGLRTG
jgi:hypothetical protein